MRIHILIKFALKGKKWDYINFHYPIKKKGELWLKLYLELGLRGFVGWLGGTSLSFSLEAPPTGRVVEARSFSKLWEAALGWRASATLSEEVPFWISGSLPCSCWLGGGGFWSWVSSAGWVTRGATFFWLGTHMAGGKKIFSGLLSLEEAQIPAWLRASPQVWAQ